jgi:putative DNA primase/helicase
VAIHPKYRDAYSPHIPAVILAIKKNPIRFTAHSGGVSRRRVIPTFPEVILEKSVTHSYSTKSAPSWAALFGI